MSGVPQKAAPPRIVDVVLGPPPSRPSGRLAIALLIGIGVHVALVAYALRLTHDDDPKPEAKNDKPYEVEPPPEPPKPPAPTPPAVVPPPETQPTVHTQVARAPHASPVAPQAPAQAGKVIGQEPDPDAPVDMSGDVVVTGSGTAFAGGKTTTGGTSKQPVAEVVPGPVAEGPVRKGKPAPPPVDHSHPVGLPDDDWSCPWPREAEEADVDEEVVLIRVVVAIDGHVESASMVRDPGHGFGAAAMLCARGTRFTPAADRQGLAIRAQSPPVRVRFVR